MLNQIRMWVLKFASGSNIFLMFNWEMNNE